MCGIVAYTGEKDILSVLLVGLRRLEYRGYDSAGCSFIDKGEVVVFKESGKIEKLEASLKGKTIQANIGIAHTRWATHGEPNKINAHPHTNKGQEIAVVHNGILENFLELKNLLHTKGFVFISDTDTEIIPHLISMYLSQNFTMQESFFKMLNQLEGKFSITCISEHEDNRIYFARNGSPLIIGLGKDDNGKEETLIASDIPAIVSICSSYYYLQNNEWGYVEDNKIYIFNENQEKIHPTFSPLKVKSTEIHKGEFDHFMLKEIYEQPQVVDHIIKNYVNDQNEVNFNEFNLTKKYCSTIGRIIIQACGTSLNAGMIGKNYLENFCLLHTEADYSSEFRYRNPVLAGDSLVIGISQSGETADTLAGIHSAKSKFLKVLSFINNKNSSIAQESDSIIPLLAGPEIGVASTKAYVAELSTLFLFSMFLSNIKKTLPIKEQKLMINELKKIPEIIYKTLESSEEIKQIAQILQNVTDTIFLGRFYNYPTALEGALKLKEISYIHASGYAAGEFKHGPIALVTEDVPVVVITPHQGNIRSKMLSNLLEVKARKGKIISVITEDDYEIKKLSDAFIQIPKTPDYLTPITSVIPLQMLAYFTAILRGCDVDKPRNLAKSVTVE